MFETQWHLFPLQFIALFFSYLRLYKAAVFLMLLTLVLTGFCFSTHVVRVLDIVL
jgi:hypothetical protein